MLGVRLHVKPFSTTIKLLNMLDTILLTRGLGLKFGGSFVTQLW